MRQISLSPRTRWSPRCDLRATAVFREPHRHGHAGGRCEISRDLVSTNVRARPTASHRGMPCDGAGELRVDTGGTAAPARPQPSATRRERGGGGQSGRLPMGEWEAQAFPGVLAADRATAPTRGFSNCRLTSRRFPTAPNFLPTFARATWRARRRAAARPNHGRRPDRSDERGPSRSRDPGRRPVRAHCRRAGCAAPRRRFDGSAQLWDITPPKTYRSGRILPGALASRSRRCGVDRRQTSCCIA
jgi:hypothetical protein